MDIFKHKMNSWALGLIVFIVLLLGVVVGFHWYISNQNTNTNQPAVKVTEKNIETNETADWKTYENKESGFRFKYPSDVTLEPDKFNVLVKDKTIGVTVQDMNKYEDGPLGYDKENALADKKALGSSDPSVRRGFADKDSLKLLNIEGAWAKEQTILAQLDVCDVQLTREAFIYRNDTQIILTSRYNNIDELMKNNPDYFTTNTENCGSEKIWRDDKFYNDLVNGRTDNLSQKWYKDFNKILSTFKFTDSDEMAGWKIYENKEYPFTFKYPLLQASKSIKFKSA